MFNFLSTQLQRYREWRKHLDWSKRHLDFVRSMINQDKHWLANDPTARELVERYERALNEYWYRLYHEDVYLFRNRVGLDPNPTKPPVKPFYANIDTSTERHGKRLYTLAWVALDTRKQPTKEQQ